jgi:hypothetical protein
MPRSPVALCLTALAALGCGHDDKPTPSALALAAAAAVPIPAVAPACTGAITADRLRDEDFPGGYR